MKWSKLCDLNREQALSINLMTLVVFEDSFVKDAFPSLKHSHPGDQIGLFMRRKDNTYLTFILEIYTEKSLCTNPTPILCKMDKEFQFHYKFQASLFGIIFFFLICWTHVHFWVHWHPCFWLWVISPLGCTIVEAYMIYIPWDSPLVWHLCQCVCPA